LTFFAANLLEKFARSLPQLSPRNGHRSTTCPPCPKNPLRHPKAKVIIKLSEEPMEWTTPSFEEINLNCEISSYANAEL